MNPTLAPLTPYGLEVRAAAAPSADLRDLAPESVHQWLRLHRVALFRGFRALDEPAFIACAERLGELLRWEFGYVNHLRVDPHAKNYLFTTSEVPLHWDGAFAARVPRYIFFQCRAAPAAGGGGETLFAETTRVLASATPEERSRWAGVEVTYSTEKVVHYGGSVRVPLLGRHPVTHEEVLRFAEPVVDLNPVRLDIHGLPPAEHAEFLASMRRRLYAPEVCLAVPWSAGDFLLADNHALLHGRRAFAEGGARDIERINVL